MKKSLKISLVLMLIIASVFAVCMFDAGAEETTIVNSGVAGDLTWILTSDGTLTITGNGPMPDYYYETLPWYSYRNDIVEVIIESGVTSIGRIAFSTCYSLTSIVIPDSVTSIGEDAFAGCSRLASLELPDSLTSIGKEAFVNCDYSNKQNSNTAAYIQKKNGTTRYYKNGEMQTGWQQIDGNWYYFYAVGSSMGSGYMCTQSRKIGGVYYTFTSDGVCTSK